jgi:hypothetical protein
VFVTGGAQESEIRKLVSQQDIGDRTPSEFLRYLRRLAKTEVPDSFLRTLWESRLPSYIQAEKLIFLNCINKKFRFVLVS